MKIAYIKTPDVFVAGNGVIQQARTWARALELNGASVDFISPWEQPAWPDYDVVHIFSGSFWMPRYVEELRKNRWPTVHSPILDSRRSTIAYRLLAAVPAFGHRLYLMPSAHRFNCMHVNCNFIRSRDEARLLENGLGIPADKIAFVPLSIDTSNKTVLPSSSRLASQGNFCLHVGSYTDPRKNVLRLAEACGKIGLPLVICGRATSAPESEKFLHAARHLADVEILGPVPREELNWLCRKCSIFALPSLYEGVGLSALEACYLGAEVVISKIGGAPDYFANFAGYVDPMSVESIAHALKEALIIKRQPMASQHVKQNYTEKPVGQTLIAAYNKIIDGNTV